MPHELEIPGPVAARAGGGAFEIDIRPPGSKSLTNRALLLAALASGRSRLRRPLLDADDAQRMIGALTSLGAEFEREASGDLVIAGVGGRWKTQNGGVTVNLNNAGTATRFLAAAAVLAPDGLTIDGNERMRQRPIGELGTALVQMGAGVEYLSREGFPPMRVHMAGGVEGLKTSVTFPTTQSSQFISAVALIAPWMRGGITIKLVGEITSESYITMTLKLLERLGATVKTSADLHTMRVMGATLADGSKGLSAFDLGVEPDASGATYFWGAAALVPGARARVMGLGGDSLQGDANFPHLLGHMGATVTTSAGNGVQEPWIQVRGGAKIAPIMADLSDMPDTAMTLASVAAFAEGTSVVKGLKTLRVKETDRIAAMQTELAKIGVRIVTPISGDAGAISITPPEGGVDCSADAPRVVFDTYDDHRMAMSLALIGLVRPNVVIRDPKCVAKTYAGFWRDFAGMLG
ncbi:MAG TPA: 3-phosphoshikimate 1-carboxyvinyltransferase [Phycisphaerales bacterium]|nr:3-phosphoshikimate 1-carboxyvinyltransferase [Phycisphaerales bacterium]